MKNAFDLAREAIASLPPAISGQGGHPATFRAACECVRLGLGDGDALSLLQEFNRRCSPPWTEKELRHKLADARRAAGSQVRQWHRHATPTPAVRVVWRSAPRPMAEPAPPLAPEPNLTSSQNYNEAPHPTNPPLADRALPAMPDFDGPDAPHLAGWHRDGTPIFRGTQAEWREHFTRK